MSRWSLPLDKLAAKVKLDMETVVRKATLDVFTSVINLSPVDTGRFRANWNISYGTIDRTTTESTEEGRGMAEASKALDLPVGSVVYLSNSLPYAVPLENGHSNQAPRGMVRLSAVQFARYVRKAVR